MFELIKKLFKPKPTFIILNIDYKPLKRNKNILTYESFYEAVGVWPYLMEMVEKSEFKKFHYKNIQANTNTYKKIQEMLRDNLLHTRNKYSKHYKEKYILNMQAMDSLQWSPYTNNNLKDDEIKILFDNNEEYVQVTKDMIK